MSYLDDIKFHLNEVCRLSAEHPEEIASLLLVVGDTTIEDAEVITGINGNAGLLTEGLFHLLGKDEAFRELVKAVLETFDDNNSSNG